MDATSHRPHPSIRPSAEYLKTLPTLRVVTPDTASEEMQTFCRDRGFDYQIELRLETEETRYWLLTRCVGDAFEGWKEGVVLAENVKPDDYGQHAMVPYSSTNLKDLQRRDYFWMLRAELNRLLDEDEKEPPSREREKRIEELRTEMDMLMPGSQ
jgi:hypothetical protein